MRLVACALLVTTLVTVACRARSERVAYGPFGEVHVYRPSSRPEYTALVLSDGTGWRGPVVEMARVLAGSGALVVGIDLPTYVQALAASWDDAVYPAADLELLSQFVQLRVGMPGYIQPVIVGYRSGGTLAYAALGQANPNTFRGAISVGFCPRLKLAKPPGELGWRGNAATGYALLPAAAVPGRWVVLDDSPLSACAADRVEAFVKHVAHAKMVAPASEGLAAALRNAFLGIAGVPAVEDRGRRVAEVADLPLVEVPATAPQGDALAIMVTGDGGWTSIDRDIGTLLAARGVPVVGLSSVRYFWTRRTPEGAATDLARIAGHYLAAWHKRRLLLLGYSRGADVLPFMVNRLPADLRRRTALVVLIGPERRVDFEFHLADWVGGPSACDQPVLPEAEKLQGLRVLCVYGSQESDSLCPGLDPSLARRFALPGGHHFGGDYDAIAARILSEARP